MDARAPHRLATLVAEAAAGSPPPADGVTEVLPPPPGPADAVVAFTWHFVVAADVDGDEVAAHLAAHPGRLPTDPRFLTWLADRLGTDPGTYDVVLAAPSLAGGPVSPPVELHPLDDPAAFADHPLVARSAAFRPELTVLTDRSGAGIVVLGRGLAGRWEVAFEVAPSARGAGLGRRLLAAARHLMPPGGVLVAQVAPGNVASLRAILAAGFRPVASEVLFPRA